MSYSKKIQRLKGVGRFRTDEGLSVALGEKLGGDGPSTRSISRWRTGEARPTRAYQNAIDRLYGEHIQKE